MKKAVILLLVVLTLVATMLVGCSPSSQPETSSAAASASANPSDAASSAAPAEGEGKTLTVMASNDWVKDAEIALSEKFTEETGIKVDYQIIPSDQYPNLLTTKLNSGECADIFMHQSGKFDIVSLLQIEKNAVDLSGEEWVSRFDEAVKDQVSANGKVYGVTLWDQGDSYAYIYNKQIFSDLGLNVPTNFAEFKQVCQTLLDNGITPIYECVADGWHHQLNFFDVASAYDKSKSGLIDELNANKTTFAQNEAFATMLTQMKEVVDAGYWGEDYMSNEYADLPAALAGGEYGMAVNMMGRVGLITEADPNQSADNFGFFRRLIWTTR